MAGAARDRRAFIIPLMTRQGKAQLIVRHLGEERTVQRGSPTLVVGVTSGAIRRREQRPVHATPIDHLIADVAVTLDAPRGFGASKRSMAQLTMGFKFGVGCPLTAWAILRMLSAERPWAEQRGPEDKEASYQTADDRQRGHPAPK